MLFECLENQNISAGKNQLQLQPDVSAVATLNYIFLRLLRKLKKR